MRMKKAVLTIGILFLITMLSGCGKNKAKAVSNSENIEKLSPGTYIDNGISTFNITDNISGNSDILYLDKDSIMLTLGLSERIPNDEERDVYRKAAEELDLLFDEGGKSLILYNDKHDIYLYINGDMYLLDQEPRFLESPVIEKDGKIQIPFSSVMFAAGYTGYTQDKNQDVTVYRLQKEAEGEE